MDALLSKWTDTESLSGAAQKQAIVEAFLGQSINNSLVESNYNALKEYYFSHLSVQTVLNEFSEVMLDISKDRIIYVNGQQQNEVANNVAAEINSSSYTETYYLGLVLNELQRNNEFDISSMAGSVDSIKYEMLQNINKIAIGDGSADSIQAGVEQYILIGDAGNDVLTGDNNRNLLFGEKGNDITRGYSGNDVIIESSGNDIIDGGTGNDSITDELGDDKIYGGDGNDTIIDKSGNDIILGGNNNDVIRDYAGNDVIDGGAGDDVIVDMLGDDTITGGDGNDTITDHSGNDVIDGGIGDDIIVDMLGDDRIYGGNGNDFIADYAGNDLLLGGLGDDKYLAFAGSKLVFDIYGNDTITGGSDNDFIIDVMGNDTIDGGAGDDVVLNINGGESDIISGGGAGDDMIYDFGGDIIYFIGSGNDTIEDYGGNDKYVLKRGDGINLIHDFGGNDTFHFGEGISQKDVRIQEQGNYLVINLWGGTEDVWYVNNKKNDQIDFFTFEDGSSYNNKQFTQMAHNNSHGVFKLPVPESFNSNLNKFTDTDISMIIQDMAAFAEDSGIDISNVNNGGAEQEQLINIITDSTNRYM